MTMEIQRPGHETLDYAHLAEIRQCAWLAARNATTVLEIESEARALVRRAEKMRQESTEYRRTAEALGKRAVDIMTESAT